MCVVDGGVPVCAVDEVCLCVQWVGCACVCSGWGVPVCTVDEVCLCV